jgi:hypothetical protein
VPMSRLGNSQDHLHELSLDSRFPREQSETGLLGTRVSQMGSDSAPEPLPLGGSFENSEEYTKERSIVGRGICTEPPIMQAVLRFLRKANVTIPPATKPARVAMSSSTMMISRVSRRALRAGVFKDSPDASIK